MAVCLLLQGFFSGSEIGIVSADRMKLRHDAAKGSRGARLALKMLEKPDWLLSTTLVGTNISTVTNTTMATALVIQLFGENYSWLTIAVMAPMIWVFGEIVPKSVFQQRSDEITPLAIFVLRFASLVFYPILAVFTLISSLLTRLLGGEARNPFTLREEILAMLRMPAKDVDIEPDEKSMIRRIFEFSETTAYEIMVPLIDVVAVEKGVTCGHALETAVEKAHSRLSVYDERVDRVVGMINMLELLTVDPDEPISDYTRSVTYVPGARSIRDLLMDMRHDGDAMVVVVDEFGGAEGIVTMEDIMEDVVEEIEDEYDVDEEEQQLIFKVSDRDFIVSARIELDDFEEKLGLSLPRSNYATLAGFLLGRAREIPEAGTTIESNGVFYTIQRATPQVIQEVRVRW